LDLDLYLFIGKCILHLILFLKSLAYFQSKLNITLIFTDVKLKYKDTIFTFKKVI